VLEVKSLVSTKIKDCIGCREEFVVVVTVENKESLPKFCSELCEVRYNYERK